MNVEAYCYKRRVLPASILPAGQETDDDMVIVQSLNNFSIAPKFTVSPAFVWDFNSLLMHADVITAAYHSLVREPRLPLLSDVRSAVISSVSNAGIAQDLLHFRVDYEWVSRGSAGRAALTPLAQVQAHVHAGRHAHL